MEKSNLNYSEQRPWGSFEILLDEDACKIKKITVNSGERLSYQFHYKRSECWTVVYGKAKVRLDDKFLQLNNGDSVKIPALAKHSVENISSAPLVFIEVQTGEYFGEDDIVRLEDKYGRE